MSEILWKIFAIILVVILVFIAPILMFYDRMDATSYNIAYDAVNEFADASREVGVINKSNYDKFAAKLGATGLIYDVEVEHYKKVYFPVIGDDGRETGEIMTSYQGVFDSDILESISDEDYLLEAGDMLYVRVFNKSPSMGESLKARIFGLSISEGTIYVRSGGMVHSSGVD